MSLRFIAHIDLDCYFVSVERISNPSLIGKPVVVGGSASRRGVVASASYEARVFGVRSAMPTAQALRLCPHLVVVSGRHGEYSEYSDRLLKRLIEISPVVERASIDEMYLDFTGCESLYSNDLPEFMKKLQRMVMDEFQLPSTIALASNKLVAKIAANTVKPAGVIFVPHGSEEQFLAPLPMAVIPGVGKKTEEFLTKKGYATVADLQKISMNDFIELLGVHGEWLHHASHGRGSTTLETEHIAKSISREETFECDISDWKEMEKLIYTLVEDVCSTLRSKSLKAQIVTLKYRTSEFKTVIRQQSIEASNFDPQIFNAAKSLLQKLHDGKRSIRLLGVGLSNFTDETQTELGLFPVSEKFEKVVKVIDKLRDKYGDESIEIGGGC